MTPTWLIPDKLCTYDEKVRVELGPQIVELDCNDDNLSDAVTAPHYRIGGRDAYGRFIRPSEMPATTSADKRIKAQVHASIANERKRGVYGVILEGAKMSVVDWRGKHKPHVWKVYQMQETEDLDKEGKPIRRFIQVGWDIDKANALAMAEQIARGM